MNTTGKKKTAADAGWHLSRYNLTAPCPGDDSKLIIVNTFRGHCAAYNLAELYLLKEFDTLSADHPILERFAKRGLIVNFDELEAIKAAGRLSNQGKSVSLTICPTMGCNFNCPYCFERHVNEKMTEEVQAAVVKLAEKLLEHFFFQTLCGRLIFDIVGIWDQPPRTQGNVVGQNVSHSSLSSFLFRYIITLRYNIYRSKNPYPFLLEADFAG